MKISAPHGHLEASIREPEEDPRAQAVVCHPHPQHGGTMHTKAVFRTAQALNDVGIRALRFNFRGVGASTGEWSEGIGERDDVRAALEWLATDLPDLPMVLAGFSFGSRIGLSVGVEDERIRAMVGLGLPVSMYEFDFLRDVDRPLLVVQGAEDEFGPEPAIRRAVEPFGDNATLEVIPGSNHYFDEHFDELQAAIRAFFEVGAGARAVGAGGR